MQFSEDRPIYLQIAAQVSNKILSGELEAGARIPSVREYAAELGVNPNTLVRAYDYLTEKQVIHVKRGLGYFVSDDARARVLDIEQTRFFETELPLLKERMRLLGLSVEIFKDN